MKELQSKNNLFSNFLIVIALLLTTSILLTNNTHSAKPQEIEPIDLDLNEMSIPTIAIENLWNMQPIRLTADEEDIDQDMDGLSDKEEQIYGTNILAPDTDFDGLLDGAEVKIYSTKPLEVDSDRDYIADSLEVFIYHTDPLVADMDYDGLNDGLEIWRFKTDVRNPDSDGDFLSDHDEVRIFRTDPHIADYDGDGLSDGIEVHIYNTSPTQIDTDGDNLADKWEVENNHNPLKKDNWDQIFGLYILVPTISLTFLLLGLFASVDMKKFSFGFKSIFERQLSIEVKQQQLLDLLALVPKNERINIDQLAEKTGETKEYLMQLLEDILQPDCNADGNKLNPDTCTIHTHSEPIDFNFTCFYCGEVIDINNDKCENCHEEIAKCKVCLQPVNYQDNYATYTNCGIAAKEDDIVGFMSVEVICESCLMKNRYNYI